jgi:hypothetical protein
MLRTSMFPETDATSHDVHDAQTSFHSYPSVSLIEAIRILRFNFPLLANIFEESDLQANGVIQECQWV